MNSQNDILTEDVEWYKNFQKMKVPEQNCDICRSTLATRWYDNTSVMLCNNPDCYREQDRRYNNYVFESSWDNDDNYRY